MHKTCSFLSYPTSYCKSCLSSVTSCILLFVPLVNQSFVNNIFCFLETTLSRKEDKKNCHTKFGLDLRFLPVFIWTEWRLVDIMSHFGNSLSSPPWSNGQRGWLLRSWARFEYRPGESSCSSSSYLSSLSG